MATYLDGAAGAQANPSMNHLLQRHRDVLFDYTREFKKTKVNFTWNRRNLSSLPGGWGDQANIRSSREHAELLRTVQEDIRQVQRPLSVGTSYHTGASSSQDMLLTERGRIDNSHRMANQILEQANETKDSLGKQRGMLAGMNRRIALTASQIPGLNSVIGKIGRRKRRDSVILAGVISNLGTQAETLASFISALPGHLQAAPFHNA
ncbi:MAG: hypothetical protein BJ554DRAFT_1041, partial [Olpidium bornovanus]